MYISPDGSLSGYLEHSLAYFNTTHFPEDARPRNPSVNVELCRYPDYREPPNAAHPYDRTYLYWSILAARLAFVVIFENFVAVVMIIVRWAIPDMSAALRDRIRREAYITNEIIIKQESFRAKLTSRAESYREPATPEPFARIENIEELMSENLSRSELDLAMHGPDDPIAPGHSKPRLNLANMNNAFLESEKTGGKKRPQEKKNSAGDDEVETSKL